MKAALRDYSAAIKLDSKSELSFYDRGLARYMVLASLLRPANSDGPVVLTAAQTRILREAVNDYGNAIKIEPGNARTGQVQRGGDGL